MRPHSQCRTETAHRRVSVLTGKVQRRFPVSSQLQTVQTRSHKVLHQPFMAAQRSQMQSIFSLLRNRDSRNSNRDRNSQCDKSIVEVSQRVTFSHLVASELIGAQHLYQTSGDVEEPFPGRDQQRRVPPLSPHTTRAAITICPDPGRVDRDRYPPTHLPLCGSPPPSCTRPPGRSPLAFDCASPPRGDNCFRPTHQQVTSSIATLRHPQVLSVLLTVSLASVMEWTYW